MQALLLLVVVVGVRGPALRCVLVCTHGTFTKRQVHFQPLDWKWTLPFHNRLACSRVHRRSASPLRRPPFSQNPLCFPVGLVFTSLSPLLISAVSLLSPRCLHISPTILDGTNGQQTESEDKRPAGHAAAHTLHHLFFLLLSSTSSIILPPAIRVSPPLL